MHRSNKHDLARPERPTLADAVAVLDRLDALRRGGQGPAHRDYARTFGEYVEVRGKLTPEDRAAVDEHSQALWGEYTAFLAQEEAARAPSLRRPARQETTAPGRKPAPTTALPGTPEKASELARRVRHRMDLHTEGDVLDDEERGLAVRPLRNGARGGCMVEKAVKLRNGTPDPPSRLRILRERAGLTLKALARRSGLSRRCVSLLESGARRFPRPETLMALATTLGLTVDELLGRKRPSDG